MTKGQPRHWWRASSTRPVHRCTCSSRRMMIAARVRVALDAGVRKPVVAPTDSGEAPSNGECSGWSDSPPADLQECMPVRPGTGFVCGALPSGRPWSTALAAENNEGYRRELWPAKTAVTALMLGAWPPGRPTVRCRALASDGVQRAERWRSRDGSTCSNWPRLPVSGS
jgi:hypothetical protein